MYDSLFLHNIYKHRLKIVIVIVVMTFPQEVDDVAIFAAVTHKFNVNKLFVRASPTCSHFSRRHPQTPIPRTTSWKPIQSFYHKRVTRPCIKLEPCCVARHSPTFLKTHKWTGHNFYRWYQIFDASDWCCEREINAGVIDVNIVWTSPLDKQSDSNMLGHFYIFFFNL